MRIDFDIDDAYMYAEERFRMMSAMDGGKGEGGKAYTRARPGLRLRAAVKLFPDAVYGDGININEAFIPCLPLKNAKGSVYAYALTAGECPSGGGTLSDALTDMWYTAFVDAGVRLLREKILADNSGKHVSRPFGPGFYGIGINEVETIFNAVNGREADIEIKNHLLYPVKSSIGFFIVSDDKINMPPRDCESCAGGACEYCRNNTVKIRFENENKTVSVPAGTTAAQAARIAGIGIETPCGGMGICGKCEGIVTINGDTKIVKLCRKRIYNDASVCTRVIGAAENGDIKINTDIEHDLSGQYYFAADIGTTTIAAELINGGRTVARAGMLNPQAVYAADVIGRIKLASENEAMHELVINAINMMIGKLTAAVHIGIDKISGCVITGNTVMQTVAAGISPKSLGHYPYKIPETFGRVIDAERLGIRLMCGVFFPPVISAFVGGDALCGILETGLRDKDGTALIDIGTNGEIAYMKNGSLIVTSAAAGPALEGVGTAFGMRAEGGAVSRFRLASRGMVMVETIDKAPAVGICGSGLTDIISELVKCGIISADGTFCDKRLIAPQIRGRLCEYNGEAAFKVCADIYITQSDIRAVQLAKGAIRAAFETVAPDAENVIIAGALGSNAGAEGLTGVGILPERLQNRIEFEGNTALRGAVRLLTDTSLREKARTIAAEAKAVELSDSEEFKRLFVKYMNFGR